MAVLCIGCSHFSIPIAAHNLIDFLYICTKNMLMLLMSFGDGIISSFLYASIGILMALLVTKIVDWVTPGNLFHQLTDERNMPLAVFTGLLALGICIIIAAAISG